MLIVSFNEAEVVQVWKHVHIALMVSASSGMISNYQWVNKSAGH